MKLLGQLVAGIFIGCLAFGANAANPSKDEAKAEYKAAMEHADANYKAAKEHCKTLSGNDRDVCMKQAKADYKSAKAEAKAKRTEGVAEANKTEDKMEARYEVEKEKCDALSGDAKSSCIEAAKRKYHQ
ncbi:MAG TPA: cell envelope biogenesis protein TolA [Burkholderiales bacterium]|nr:cell envelope biogenesis protein TolA [Burkholderiales bacterium]